MTIAQLYSIWQKHSEVITDSRNVISGCLFFALKGENFDGNEFAEKALQAGAAYAITDRPLPDLSDRYIIVDDVLDTLQQLASFHRCQLKIPVIAITGTNGKTTTKELTAAVLSKKYRTAATKGNLNNHIGVPLTLLSLRNDTEIAIIEMGANHIGEIAALCSIAQPTHGLITNIGKAHLEGFGGFEGVKQAKMELYQYLRSKKGIIFINNSDRVLLQGSCGLTLATYGTGENAGVTGANISSSPFLSLDINLPEKINVKTELFGNYNATNILAAACIGKYFEVEPGLIKQALGEYKPVNSRSQILTTTRNRVVLDAYNANPSSMEQAILNFMELPGENKVFILGDMLELGEESESEHRKILELLEKVKAKQVFLVGPEFLDVNTNPEWHCFQDSDLAAMWFMHFPVEGADILLKGSRGIKMERVVEWL